MTVFDDHAGAPLCALSDIPEGRPFEVSVGEGRRALPLILFRQGGGVAAYLNRCPHFQIPLNPRPDAFLLPEPGLIMCGFHSAVFRVADGLCIDGPCKGARLRPAPVTVSGGRVFLGEPAPAGP